MVKQVGASEARRRLGMLLDDVHLNNAEYIIARAGRPVAVVLPVEAYRQHQLRREEAFDRISALRQHLAEYGEANELQAAINEATRRSNADRERTLDALTALSQELGLDDPDPES